jgi:hypothetical protein
MTHFKLAKYDEFQREFVNILRHAEVSRVYQAGLYNGFTTARSDVIELNNDAMLLFTYHKYFNINYTINQKRAPDFVEFKWKTCDEYFKSNEKITGDICNATSCCVIRQIYENIESVNKLDMFLGGYPIIDCNHFMILPFEIAKKWRENTTYDEYLYLVYRIINSPFCPVSPHLSDYDTYKSGIKFLFESYEKIRLLMPYLHFNEQLVIDLYDQKNLVFSLKALLDMCSWTYSDRYFARDMVKLIFIIYPHSLLAVYLRCITMNDSNSDEDYGNYLHEWLLNEVPAYANAIARKYKNKSTITINSQMHINCNLYMRIPEDTNFYTHRNITVTSYNDYQSMQARHDDANCDVKCIFSAKYTYDAKLRYSEWHHKQHIDLLRCVIKMRLRQFCHMSRLVLGAIGASMHQKLLMTLILRTIGPIYWAAPNEIEEAIKCYSARITMK